MPVGTVKFTINAWSRDKCAWVVNHEYDTLEEAIAAFRLKYAGWQIGDTLYLLAPSGAKVKEGKK